MIVEPSLLVALVAGEPVPLEAHLGRAAAGLERGRAERMVFLVRDQGSGVVELDGRRPEVIANLVAQHRRCTRVRLDERDALRVVHDVQRFTRRRIDTERVMHLVGADVDRLRLRVAVLVINDLAHATTGRVVRVVGGPAAAEVSGGEVIVRIPVQRHRSDARDAPVRIVALSIDVAIRLNTSADRRARQPVALLAQLERTPLAVVVSPRPTASARDVPHRREVVRRVVLVALGVCTQCPGVVRVSDEIGEPGQIEVPPARRRRRECVLPDMFAPGRFDEPVRRVVHVTRPRRHHLVVEEHGRRRAIGDGADVANRVVRVVQIGDDGWVDEQARGGRVRRGGTGRPCVDQPPRQRIVVVAGRRAVSVIDPHALALGVVVDVVNQRCLRAAPHVDGDRLKQVALGERRPIHARIRSGHGAPPIHRVVRDGDRIRGAVQHWCGLPVDWSAVIRQHVALRLERIALEVVRHRRRDAGRIVGLVHPRAVVARHALALAVHRLLDEPLDTVLRHEHAEGAAQVVVLDQARPQPRVPRTDQLAGDVGDSPPLPRVHACLMDPVAEHVVVVARRNATVGVADTAMVALDVELDARGVRLLDRDATPHEPVLRNRQIRASHRVEMSDRRRLAVHRRPLGSDPLRVVDRQRDPLLVPGRCAVCCRKTGDEPADIRVRGEVGRPVRVQRRVVGVVVGLLPRVEDDLLDGVIRPQRRNNAPERVVAAPGTDSDAGVGVEGMRVAEERLEAANGLALVVEHSPAAADPARCVATIDQDGLSRAIDDDRAVVGTLRHQARLGLDLALDLSVEPIGVGERDVNCRVRAAGQVAPVSLTQDRRRARRDVREVVDDARGRRAEMRHAERPWIGCREVRGDLVEGEVRFKVVERVTRGVGRLGHHCGPDDEPERVERHG